MQLNKMAATSIHGKNSSSSPEPRKLWGWILVYSIEDSSFTKFDQMMIIGWPLTFLQQDQICVCRLVWEEKLKNHFYAPGSELGTYCFCPVCLLICWLDNFNIGHNFWTVWDRAFIFGMLVLCDKGFPLIQNKITSDLDLDLWPTLKKKLTLIITFDLFEIEPLYLAFRFFVTRASHSYKTKNFDLWPWPLTYFKEKNDRGLITFEPFKIEPLYLACRFLVTRASHSYKKLTCDLDLDLWPTVKKKLTLVITFEPFQIEPSYLACRILVTRASHSYKKFWPVTLTLICDLL